MAFRMHRYAIAAMQNHLDAGYKTLPLVIPILFYTGKRSPYPYSTNWLKGFTHPAQAKKLYSNDYPLVDITVIPDEEIMEHRSMAALTLLQKHIHKRNLTELMDKLVASLLTEYLPVPQVTALIHYIIQAGETADAEVFIRELASRVPQYEDNLMTIAQQLEQNGINKGMLLGREEGIRLERRSVAQNMLQQGLDYDMVIKITGLCREELISPDY